MKFLTEKGVVVVSTGERLTLCDPVGNTCSCDIGERISSVLQNKYGLSAIFLIDESLPDTSGNNIDIDKTSLILNIDDGCLTYLEWADSLLSKIRILEWTASQLIYGKTFHSDEVIKWEAFHVQNELIRDCHCDSKSYNQFINHWSKECPDLTISFQAHYELTRLIEIVRFEMGHAESRIREAINSITTVIQVVHNAENLVKGSEVVKFGVSVDQIGWCITDTVKSLSTALDAVTKFVFVISKVAPRTMPKTPAVLAGNLPQYKPKGELIPDDRHRKIKESYSKVKSLINLRHELTHNQALYPVRRPAFVGYATPCVNGEELAYGEILWWDMDGDHFARSCGRIGFFTEKRNAIIEATTAFKNTCTLIDTILETARLEVLSSARRLNLNEICVFDIDPKYNYKFVIYSVAELVNFKEYPGCDKQVNKVQPFTLKYE